MASWADQDETAPTAGGKSRLETKPDKDGVKTVIEYVERDGKSYKITKKVRTRQVTHRLSAGVVARRSLPKFLGTLDDAADTMAKMTTEKEEVMIEPRVKRTKDDDMNVPDVLGTAKKSVWSKFRGPGAEGGADGAGGDKKEELPPMPPTAHGSGGGGGAEGRYVPPSLRGGMGAGTSLNDLRAQEQKDRDALTLRVTNLSEDVREGDLADLFGQFGRTQRIFLAKNPETKQSKGFAFITYSSRQDAETAIKRLNGHGYDNLVLRVEFSKPAAPRPGEAGKGEGKGAAPTSTADFRAQLNRPAF